MRSLHFIRVYAFTCQSGRGYICVGDWQVVLSVGETEWSRYESDSSSQTDGLVGVAPVLLTCLNLSVLVNILQSGWWSHRVYLCRCRRPKSQQASVVLMWDRLLLVVGECGDTIQYPWNPGTHTLEPVTDLFVVLFRSSRWQLRIVSKDKDSTLTLTLGSPLRTSLCWWENWTGFGSSAQPLRSCCRRFPWSVRTSLRLPPWPQEPCFWRPTGSTRFTSADLRPFCSRCFRCSQVWCPVCCLCRSPVRRLTSTWEKSRSRTCWESPSDSVWRQQVMSTTLIPRRLWWGWVTELTG